jgi:hypothetical protein
VQLHFGPTDACSGSMRALAVMSIAASLAGCAKPGRGEHLVHWPDPISGLALDASGIYASVATPK